jgi:hypothetical protein
MWEFAMAHEVICLIVVLSLIWACERAFTALVNRDKPVCDCKCYDEDEEEEDDSSEVVAAGGEEEDDS